MTFKPRLLQLLVFLLCAAFNLSANALTPDLHGVLYVKKGGAGTANGDGWANAAAELADALNAARTSNAASAGTVKQIWVAAGTYFPTTQVDGGTSNARRKTFSLLKDVQIYGRFDGTETSIADRSADPAQNITTLSGDIGVVNSSTDNAYHVVTGYGTLGSAILDGFTITDGYANDYTDQTSVSNFSIFAQYGGGLYLTNLASLTVNDVIFTNNYAVGYGGAAFVYSNSEATFNRVTFTNNSANAGGAVTAYNSSRCSYNQTSFSGNFADVYGGAIFASNTSTQTFDNVSITGNSSGANGGGIAVAAGSNITANRLVVQGNHAEIAGGGISQNQASGNYTNTLIAGNLASMGGGIYVNITSNRLVNSTIAGNQATSGSGGGIFNSQSTAIIDNSVIADNNSAIYNSGGGSHTARYSFVQGETADAVLHNLDGTQSPGFTTSPASSSAPFSNGVYSLQSSSPLVNAGSNALYAGLDAAEIDLAGNARVSAYAIGGVIDIGAYEKLLDVQTINTSGISKTYGDAEFGLTFTASTGLPVTYSSSDEGIVQVYQDAAAGNAWKASIRGAGVATITASQAGDQTYAPVSSPFNVSIAPAVLIITAIDASKVYGQALPELALTYTGLVYTDLPSSLGGALALSTNATATSAVGNYLITANGATSSNYSIIYVPGQLTVTPAAILVTPTAGQTKEYGANDPIFTYTATGLVDSDTLSGALGRAAGEDVGSYALTLGSLAVVPSENAGNYSITYVPGQFTVTPAAILVTPTAGQTKEYGASDPVFTYTETGLVDNDTLSGALGRDAGEDVGSYAVTLGSLAVVPSENSGNYSMALAPASFEITQATTAAVLSSSAASAAYGDSIVLTAAVSASTTLSPPSGTVTFTDGGEPIAACTDVMLVDGQASCTVDSLAVGPHALAVNYSGDSHFKPSSGTLAQVVDSAQTSITLEVTPTSVQAGQSVTLTAQVGLSGSMLNKSASTLSALSGSVEFADAGASLGIVPLDANGEASLTLAGLSEGEHSLSATYTDGSANYAEATVQITLNVAAAALPTTTPVPIGSWWMLALLAMVLAFCSAQRIKR